MQVTFDFSHQGHALVTLRPIFMLWLVKFSPCLMRKRVEKSEAILAVLDSFQCISNGKPDLLYLMFVFYI